MSRGLRFEKSPKIDICSSKQYLDRLHSNAKDEEHVLGDLYWIELDFMGGGAIILWTISRLCSADVDVLWIMCLNSKSKQI